MAIRKPLSDPALEALIRRAAEELQLQYPALFAGSEPLTPEEVAAANREDEQAYATLDHAWQEDSAAAGDTATSPYTSTDAVNETRASFYDDVDTGKDGE